MDTATVVSEFVLEEFLAGDGVDHIDQDFDLIATGIIDSLGLLGLVGWMQDQFDVVLDDSDLGPNDFRTVRTISNLIDAFRAGRPTDAS